IAWRKVAWRLSKAELVTVFLQRCRDVPKQNGELKELDRVMGCAVLGLLPLIDAESLFNNADFWNLSPSKWKGVASHHILELGKLVQNSECKARIISALQAAISLSGQWASSSPRALTFKRYLNYLSEGLKSPQVELLPKALQQMVTFLDSR